MYELVYTNLYTLICICETCFYTISNDVDGGGGERGGKGSGKGSGAVIEIYRWYQMIDITWGPGFEGNLM
jgi:hypothetical protein